MWKDKARTRAYEIIKRDSAKNIYPSQVDICNEIAKEFHRDGIKSTNRKQISSSYIKRFALNGISSAKNKLISKNI